jgi:hypothetical protein
MAAIATGAAISSKHKSGEAVFELVDEKEPHIPPPSAKQNTVSGG